MIKYYVSFNGRTNRIHVKFIITILCAIFNQYEK